MVSVVTNTLTSIEEQFGAWMPTSGRLKELTCTINGVNFSIYFQRVYDLQLYDTDTPRRAPIANKMNVISDNSQIREIFEKHFPKSIFSPNYYALNKRKLTFDLRFFHNKNEFNENMAAEKLKYGPKQRSCGRVCVDACFVV